MLLNYYDKFQSNYLPPTTRFDLKFKNNYYGGF